MSAGDLCGEEPQRCVDLFVSLSWHGILPGQSSPSERVPQQVPGWKRLSPFIQHSVHLRYDFKGQPLASLYFVGNSDISVNPFFLLSPIALFLCAACSCYELEMSHFLIYLL